MPTYEYHCNKCGDFEVSQRITESPLKKCPTCKGKVERLISHSSFILRGSGWYATDYARKGSSTTSDSSSEGAAKSESKSESKTETKTETKPAPKSEPAAKPAA